LLETRDVLDGLLVRLDGDRFLLVLLLCGRLLASLPLGLPLRGFGRAEQFRQWALTHARAPSRH
jgi:hypothetical protein